MREIRYAQSIRLASTNKVPNNMELTTFLPWTVTGWEWPKENVKHRLRNSAGQKWFWKGFLWRRGEGGEKGKGGGKGEEEVLTCHYLIGILIFVIFWSKAYASRTNFLWYLHHGCFSLNACQRSLIVAQPIRNWNEQKWVPIAGNLFLLSPFLCPFSLPCQVGYQVSKVTTITKN